ncbi:MAG: helix-turn-helix domain-containing protein [Patescibacteria group bacterium]
MIRLGQKLREARMAKGLSLEEVAQATKIRSSFLASIERSDYHKLPSSSYALGFVQNYAEYLGLPRKETLALFRREFDTEKAYKVLPEGFVKDESMPKRRFKIQQAFFLVVVALVFLGGFLLYQYRAAFINPPLTVTSPKEGNTVGADVLVSGKTDPNVSLSINNTPVAVSDDGEFSKTITTFPGKAAITVRALNSFGKETVIIRQIQVRSSP